LATLLIYGPNSRNLFAIWCNPYPRPGASCSSRFAPGRSTIWSSLVRPSTPPGGELFEPLRAGTVDDLVVIGQIGQSLDGRIATASGHSKYINGPAGVAHLHKVGVPCRGRVVVG